MCSEFDFYNFCIPYMVMHILSRDIFENNKFRAHFKKLHDLLNFGLYFEYGYISMENQESGEPVGRKEKNK